jgi:leucyl-tRNA synthetase
LWPTYDEELAAAEEVTIGVQINGKLRDRLTVPADMDEEALTAAVLERERVRQYLDGRSVVKLVVVPNKLVSIAVAGPG